MRDRILDSLGNVFVATIWFVIFNVVPLALYFAIPAIFAKNSAPTAEELAVRQERVEAFKNEHRAAFALCEEVGVPPNTMMMITKLSMTMEFSRAEFELYRTAAKRACAIWADANTRAVPSDFEYSKFPFHTWAPKTEMFRSYGLSDEEIDEIWGTASSFNRDGLLNNDEEKRLRVIAGQF